MSTKIHAAGDALGNPVRLIASPGQRNDIAFAHDLVDGFEAGATLADKGYDADHLCEAIAETGAQVVIPPKRNRKSPRPYDADLYKERNVIERFGYRYLAQIVKSSLRPSTGRRIAGFAGLGISPSASGKHLPGHETANGTRLFSRPDATHWL